MISYVLFYIFMFIVLTCIFLVDKFNQLRSDFDAQLEKMQEPETKRKMKEAFDASPEELGKAAVEAIKETTNGCDCQVRRGEKIKMTIHSFKCGPDYFRDDYDDY